MKHLWLACGIVFCLGVAGPWASAAQSPRAVHATPAALETTRPLPLKPHPVVALTFDDLPAAGGLRPGETRVDIATRLTSELRASHLKGVYGFVTAVDLDDDPDTQQALRIWVRAGMNIGSHTWSHPSLTHVTAAAFEHNVALNQPALRQYSRNRNWRWFRYPYLHEGDTLAKRDDVHAWLRQHGYRIAQVTLNFEDDDWGDPYLRCMAKHDHTGIAWLRQSYLQNAAEFIRLGRQQEQIAFGHEIPNVLLLHATEFTTLMLPALLHLLHQDGFRFASLAKVEKNPAYALDPAVALPQGGTLTEQVLVAHHRKPQPPPFHEPVQQLDSLCR